MHSTLVEFIYFFMELGWNVGWKGDMFYSSVICSWVPSKPLFSCAQNVPCPEVHYVSLNFIVPIAHLFLFHTMIITFSTLFLMQTMHHPLFPLTILANHTPPTSSFDQPQPFVQMWGPILHFLNPLDNAHVGPFPFPFYQPLQLFMIRAPNLPTSPQHTQTST